MTDRRQVLGAGLALAAPVFSFPASASGLSNVDPLEIFTRLRCAPEGRPVWWWFSGHILGRLQGEAAQPVLTIQGANVSRMVRQSDGSVVYSMIEAGYYGRPLTPGIIDGEMQNVLTGEMMTPQHFFEPLSLRFQPDLVVRPDTSPLPPGLEFNGRLVAPDIKGNRIWMAEELFIKIPAPAGKPNILLNSLANFEASVEDIEAGGDFVPATMQYTTINSFRSWMNMGLRAGDLNMRFNAMKLTAWDKLPPALRQRIEDDHGDALTR